MAGLKFYLCQTSDGPQYVHLQADAKKLDPKYETVEIDTSKQALMDRLNGLMRAESASPEPISDFEEVEEPIAPVKPQKKGAAVLHPNAPPDRPDDPMNGWRQRGYDQIGFEDFIYDIPDNELHRLFTLADIMIIRIREITHPEEYKKRAAETIARLKAQDAPKGHKWGDKE